jgi:predicted lipid carrier protein YhbT
VHSTDVAGEWLVTPSASGLEVTRAHAKAEAALRGPASDLLLRLCNRGSGGEVVGDEGVVTTFTERFTF